MTDSCRLFQARALIRATGDFFGAFTGYAGAKGWIAAGLVASGAVLDGAGLLLLIPIIGAVVTPGDRPTRTGAMLQALGAHSHLAKLAVLLGLFVALAVVRAVALFARDMALGRLQTGFIEQLRNGLMRRLAEAPWSRTVGLRHADITSLMTTEVNRVASSSQYMIQSSVAALMLVVQGGLAVLLAPWLALATAALVLIGAVIILMAQGRIRALGAGMVGMNQAMMASASGFIGGLKAAAAQNAQGDFVQEFVTIQADIRAQQLAFQRRQASSRRVFAIGSAVMGAAIIAVGIGVGLGPSVLITVVVIFARMSGPLQQIQNAAQNFFFALPAFEAIRRFEADLTPDMRGVAPPVPPPPGAIEARDISYLHPGGGGVRAASFTLEPGSFIGVSGPSGAGKTTLIDLLTTLLAPQTGEILVGGAPLDAARAAGWRETLAYVPQEGFLFHDSVRRNLTWGAAPADDQALWRALTLAGADALVRAMPQGLDTVTGERGGMLSGGERQRLAIARALLRDPRLLVLDEATNAIDAASEAALLGRLAALDPRPTIVMISHRAESMAQCDRVITIERGQLLDGAS